VNHFLTVVNHRYSAIYAPAFTDKYVQWWADRASGRRLSPEFTCLLLRVLSYSVQYLTVPLRKMIEFELACTSQVLTDRFSDAAEQLSQSFSASETSLERVQEGFLKGAWLKSESRIVESWHALSCTIREAQELGMKPARSWKLRPLKSSQESTRSLPAKTFPNLTLRSGEDYGRFSSSGIGQ
jgi:hypothetical protein